MPCHEFTAESAAKELLKCQSTFNEVTGKIVDCLKHGARVAILQRLRSDAWRRKGTVKQRQCFTVR